MGEPISEVSPSSENTIIDESVVKAPNTSPPTTQDEFKKPLVSQVVVKKNKIRLPSKLDDNEECNSDEPVGKPSVQQVPVPPLKYDEPDWAGVPDNDYYLEEIKSGVILKRIPLSNKSFFTFGRIDSCDVPMSHPTVSRYHAILQYRGTSDGNETIGFYLYDLGSTHGTFLNKYRIKPNIFGPMKVGHMVKLGCSSRLFILQGPDEDMEQESDLSYSQMKEKREEELRLKKLKEEEELEAEEAERKRQEQLVEERGISWGIGEDADEETDLSENPYAVVTNEELYIDDPKKALKSWFEREGEELEYQIEKADYKMVLCQIDLPVNTENVRDLTVKASARNKKEAQVQCALEACRTLDKLGLFRPSKRESKKIKKKNWEANDYYDSDEDSYLDRTGDLEAKRRKRMEKAGKITETPETYDSLKVKYAEVTMNLEKAERTLDRLRVKALAANEESSAIDDELDAYMAQLKSSAPTKGQMKSAETDVEKLKAEESHLRKLINIAKPAALPELIPFAPSKLIVKNDNPHPLIDGEGKRKKEPVDQQALKVIGPQLLAYDTDGNPSNQTSSKQKQPNVSRKKKRKYPNETAEDDFEDLVWKPPQGQTGDGRTALNDKLGY